MKAHANMVPHLLAMHCISGCGTVAQFFSIGKGTALKAIEAGYHLNTLGDCPLTDMYGEATRFIAKCYVVNIEDTCTQMSKISELMCGLKKCRKNRSQRPLIWKPYLLRHRLSKRMWIGLIFRLQFGDRPYQPILHLLTSQSTVGAEMMHQRHYNP